MKTPRSKPETTMAAIARMEREIEETMETVARLSHKINNPLTSLMGRTQLMRRAGGQDPGVQRAADTIEEAGRRIADYIRELSILTREHHAELRELIRDERERQQRGEGSR